MSSAATGARPARRRRLRTRLLALLLALLVPAAVLMGLASYLAVRSSLTDQLDRQLADASQRATSFSGTDGFSGGGPSRRTDQQTGQQPSQEPSHESSQGDTRTAPPDPLDAPGQAAGTLNARVDGGTLVHSGILDAKGEVTALSDADRSRLQSLAPDGTVHTERLEAGRYRVQAVTAPTGDVIITGLPLSQVNTPLGTVLAVVTAVSVLAVVLVCLLGSWGIRRALRPLERVSDVATEVSRLDLGSTRLPETNRVEARDADPRNEVGAVGHALNSMLDNVDAALTARQESEDRMARFVADASHELRTPLASIQGYADLLRMSEPLSETGAQSLERIRAQAQRMGGLVSDLLLLTRLSHESMPARQPVDLAELVVECVGDVAVAAGDHEWDLDLPEAPVLVPADGGQLHQVLVNLLANARNHTAAGTRVVAGVHPSLNAREAILTVTDNGQGIDPELLPEIFGRFTRGDTSRRSDGHTTGLGLSIVKAIVEAHHGTVEVHSRPGRTEFEVRLPLQCPGDVAAG